jgi:zinc transport system substrate-binding protein
MNMNGKIRKILSINITLVFLATPGIVNAEKLTMYVVNYPLQYFAERIGGEHINVVFPAPADIDPAYWMPDAKTISDYQHADLILLNGAGYAKWVNKATLPRFRMVDTSAGFKDQYIEAAEILTHSHGSEGEHAHESLAFTTWIDFSYAAKQAKAIAEALSRKRTDLRQIFQKNYAALEKDLIALDKTIKEVVSNNRARPLVVSHPVYDYFAHGYGLNIRSVHWEPDEILTNEQMMELNSILKEHPAKWMIWEGNPMKQSAERLKAIGVDSLVFNPCGNTPDQGNFLSVMRQNVENLKPAFQHY